MPFYELSRRVKIHFLDENPAGKQVALLLHGLGANSASWQLQIPVLVEKGWRVIAPDTPGFGQSTYAGGGVNFSKTARYFAALLENQGVSSAAIIGISMGGVQALQLALDFPTLAERLVLVNTFASLEKTSPRFLPYYVWRFILVHTLGLPAQARVVAKRIFPQPEQQILREMLIEQILQANPACYRATLRALGRFDVTSRLGEIKCPALIITGGSDTTVATSSQARLAQGIPGARQVIIPEAGHAVSVEEPDKFNSILVEFLNYAKSLGVVS